MSDKWLEVLLEGKSVYSINVTVLKIMMLREMNMELNIEQEPENLLRETGQLPWDWEEKKNSYQFRYKELPKQNGSQDLHHSPPTHPRPKKGFRSKRQANK